PPEGFFDQEPMPDALPGDGQHLVAPERHQLLDDHDPGEDDVRALRLQAADTPALPHAERLESRAHGRAVLAAHRKPARRGGPASVPRREYAAHRTQAAADADQRVARLGARQHAQQPVARLAAERPDLVRLRRVVLEKSEARAHGTERDAGDARDPPGANAGHLQAAAAQVDDRAAADGAAPEDRRRAEPRFL